MEEEEDKHPTLNVDLLGEVYEYIVAHEEMWDQESWAHKGPSCGTTYCFAGLTVLLSDAEIEWPGEDGAHYTAIFCRTPDGVRRRIPLHARELLGLTYQEAGKLWHGTDTDLFDLKRTLKKIKDGEYRD